MRIDILASGSSGNCIALTSSGVTILIDAGIAKTKIEKALIGVNINPGDVAGVFITHAHKDHVKGLPMATKYNMPVYASAGEWKSIEGSYDTRWFDDKEEVTLHYPFKVKRFNTHHDSFEPIGFVVEDIETEVRTSICLDTGHVDDDMIRAMWKSDNYIIEANHEPRMVEASDYPENVKVRIQSDIGHLSNQQTADVLAELLQGEEEKVYLTHLSSHNNNPSLAMAKVAATLFKKGLKVGKDYYMGVF